MTVWNAGLWPNHRLIVVATDGTSPPLSDLGRQCAAAFAPKGDRRKNIAIELEPQETYVSAESIELRKHFTLVPGTYRIAFEYHDGANRVKSNALTIEIGKPADR